MATISRINSIPTAPISSSRPTNGEMKLAPALAARSACGAEKHRVTLTMVPSPESARQVLRPSCVSGTLTVTLRAIFASLRPSASIVGKSSAATSALTGPGTIAQISRTTSRKLRPVLATSEGLVVTPSTSPVAVRSAISARSAVSMKNFIRAALALVSPAAGCLETLPLDGAYDYLAPESWRIAPGSFVSVPLGSRTLAGVVWAEGRADGVAAERLKPIDGVLDVPLMAEPLRRFVDWVATYTLTPPGAVLRMTMSVSEALLPPRPIPACAIADSGLAALKEEEPGKQLTTARRRVLRALAEGPPRPVAELARVAGCGVGVVRGLLDRGFLQRVLLPSLLPRESPDWRRAGPSLSPDQDVAARSLRHKIAAGGFGVTLLDGVTGSGKTEVYFAAIAAALERGTQTLVLLPEIALTAQVLGRFQARFGAAPVEWHSDLSQAERRAAWRDVADARARVVVGARSALFLPFAELGLIIVDEEHDGSFKQEDGVIYHARDMAVVRGSLARIPVILVSATPSLETLANVEHKRYDRVHLPDRHGGALLPAIHAIDLRR